MHIQHSVSCVCTCTMRIRLFAIKGMRFLSCSASFAPRMPLALPLHHFDLNFVSWREENNISHRFPLHSQMPTNNNKCLSLRRDRLYRHRCTVRRLRSWRWAFHFAYTIPTASEYRLYATTAERRESFSMEMRRVSTCVRILSEIEYHSSAERCAYVGK